MAVRESHKLLDKLGYVDIAGIKELINVIDFKYARFAPERTRVTDKLDAAVKRIENGIKEGNYFPKVTLEAMHEIKAKLEDILPQENMRTASDNLNELFSISDRLLVELTKATPKNTKARSRNLNLLWDSDPFVVLEKYSRDAIQFNKNIHIQSAYLKAMKSIVNKDTPFLKGMKSFIMEEYLVANLDGMGRVDWVNDMVRTVNGFQTARTMGLNVTGGVKNAASVLHYLSKVGPKAVFDAKKLYQNREIRKIVDRVEEEEGFLFTPSDSAIMMEGLIGKDKFRQSDLVFDQSKGEYYYKDTKVRARRDSAGQKHLGSYWYSIDGLKMDKESLCLEHPF